jgi:hypothetical protein
MPKRIDHPSPGHSPARGLGPFLCPDCKRPWTTTHSCGKAVAR